MTDSGMRDAAATSPSATPRQVRGVGERVRALRVAAGLTQTELAGARFSKEYVSQIERGKTRPTAETVAWLAERLGVDAQFLQHGVSADVRARVEAKLARAEALSEAHRDQEAVDAFREAREEIRALGSAELELRALAGEGWALQELGAAHDAIDVLQEARELTRAAGVLGRRPCRRAVPARLLPLPDLEHPDRDRAPRRRRSSSPSARASPATSFAPASSRGARAAAAARRTTRPRARTPSARSSSRSGDRRPARRRRRVLPGVAGRREDGPLGARAAVRAAGEGDLRRSSTTNGTPAA